MSYNKYFQIRYSIYIWFLGWCNWIADLEMQMIVYFHMHVQNIIDQNIVICHVHIDIINTIHSYKHDNHING